MSEMPLKNTLGRGEEDEMQSPQHKTLHRPNEAKDNATTDPNTERTVNLESHQSVQGTNNERQSPSAPHTAYECQANPLPQPSQASLSSLRRASTGTLGSTYSRPQDEPDGDSARPLAQVTMEIPPSQSTSDEGSASDEQPQGVFHYASGDVFFTPSAIYPSGRSTIPIAELRSNLRDDNTTAASQSTSQQTYQPRTASLTAGAAATIGQNDVCPTCGRSDVPSGPPPPSRPAASHNSPNLLQTVGGSSRHRRISLSVPHNAGAFRLSDILRFTISVREQQIAEADHEMTEARRNVLEDELSFLKNWLAGLEGNIDWSS